MIDKELKYQICINCCLGNVDCPDSPKRLAKEAYCFLHSDIHHPNNFLPHACQTPRRLTNESHTKKKCALFGLSFFLKESEAKKLYAHLNKSTRGRFSKQNGEFLAKVKLKNTDGVYDVIDSKSHFNFFHYHDVNLKKLIINKQKL